MSGDAVPMIQRIGQSRTILAAFMLVAVMLVAISAVRFQSPELLGQDKVLTDFDAFYIAGTLASEGAVGDAYHAASMIKAQKRILGEQSFMPWTYPPPFTLLVEQLASLPIGVAYSMFALGSFGFYLVVLHRIAGPWLPGVLVLAMPLVLLNLRTGQNGFLTAGLIGSFLLLWRARTHWAGVPLGLMIIKPHLAVGIGLMALFGKRWSVVATSAAVVLLALALATFAYGFPVWTYFLGAVKESGAFLAEGYYLLFRMSSLYAALRSWGLSTDWAMAGHLAGTVMAVGLLLWISFAEIEFHHRAALICALSLFVSPYNYDYDLTILSVGLAFIAPELAAHATPRAAAGLLAQAWVTFGYGVLCSALLATAQTGGCDLSTGAAPTVIAPMLIGLCIAITRLSKQRSENNTAPAKAEEKAA